MCLCVAMSVKRAVGKNSVYKLAAMLRTDEDACPKRLQSSMGKAT